MIFLLECKRFRLIADCVGHACSDDWMFCFFVFCLCFQKKKQKELKASWARWTACLQGQPITAVRLKLLRRSPLITPLFTLRNYPAVIVLRVISLWSSFLVLTRTAAVRTWRLSGAIVPSAHHMQLDFFRLSRWQCKHVSCTNAYRREHCVDCEEGKFNYSIIVWGTSWLYLKIYNSLKPSTVLKSCAAVQKTAWQFRICDVTKGNVKYIHPDRVFS